MAIQGLDHFNIIAPKELMEEVRDFYVDVIGLQEGYRPDFGFPGYWLYAGERPILHLMDRNSTGRMSGTGHLDHIALTCTDIGEFEGRLGRLGVDYRKSEHPGFQLTQLFLHDPVGLGVELNFKV